MRPPLSEHGFNEQQASGPEEEGRLNMFVSVSVASLGSVKSHPKNIPGDLQFDWQIDLEEGDVGGMRRPNVLEAAEGNQFLVRLNGPIL